MLSTRKVQSFSILFYWDFRKDGVKTEKLELNNPNLELVSLPVCLI